MKRKMLTATRAVALVGMLLLALPSSQAETTHKAPEDLQRPAAEQIRDVGRKARRGLLEVRYVHHDGSIITAEVLEAYLTGYASPLAEQAATIIAAGNLYDVDPRLIVAIAGVETSYGKAALSYNAWGWNNGRTRWSSWEEAIFAFAKGLAEGYPDRDDVGRIAFRYNPVTPSAWGAKVAWVMNSITASSS